MTTTSYLSTRQLAERLGLATITLELWRARGSGPPYLKLGRAVRYDLAEVERWLSDQAVDPAKPKAVGRG